jgi:hypothetical protein
MAQLATAWQNRCSRGVCLRDARRAEKYVLSALFPRELSAGMHAIRLQSLRSGAEGALDQYFAQ